MSLATPKRLKGMSPSHARARAQEKEVAAQIGGTLVRGSGSGYMKGDVRLTGKLRVECKTTAHASFSVSAKLLDKMDASVFGANEIPVMVVELLGGKRKFVVLPAEHLDGILDHVGREPE